MEFRSKEDLTQPSEEGSGGMIIRMAAYAGVQIVYAAPMVLGDYLDSRGWSSPEEDPEQEGYLVEMPEFGPSHISGCSGFSFWCTKEEFEATYSKAPPREKFN